MPEPEPTSTTPVPADPGAGVERVGTGARAAGLLRWVALGAASGVLAGLACWAFLTALDEATSLRLAHGWLVGLLPVIGLAVGLAYHRVGGRAGEGNALLLDQIHDPTDWVPRRMAPLVGVGTVVAHLGGASVGREGTALQLSGSLTDALSRRLGLRGDDRRTLLVAALGGGFGAVFGVPLAGAVFGLEVQRLSWHPRTPEGDPPNGTGATAVDQAPSLIRPLPWWVPGVGRLSSARRAPRPLLLAGFRDGTWGDRVAATLTASVVGDQVVRALGYHHERRPQLHVAIDPALLGRAAIAGVAFGLAAIAFVEATDLVRAAARRGVAWPPARPAVAGLLVLAGTALVGRSYLGLSLPLIDQALAGDPTGWEVPLLKLAFTALCVGAGFVGGEVTPLFVIGTTLGSALAPSVGLSPVVGATLGFVAVFGGATNTPLACTVMAVEIFGTGAVAPAAVACVVAYLCSGRRGIYPTQRRQAPGGSLPVAAHRSLVERARWTVAGRRARRR